MTEKVIVYLGGKNNGWSEELATFNSEDYYMVCVPALEKWAKKNGHVIHEKLVEESKPLTLKQVSEIESEKNRKRLNAD